MNRTIYLLTVIGLMIFTQGCSPPQQDSAPFNAELAKKIELWEESKQTLNGYSMTTGYLCGSCEDYQLTVNLDASDNLVSHEAKNTDGDLLDAYEIKSYDITTVEKMFEALEFYMAYADFVSVEYDEEKGFPKEIFVDQFVFDAGDEFLIQISDFQAQ